MTIALTNSLDDFIAQQNRVLNFSAGPATLPEDVLRQAQQDLWSLFGTGIGILEHSHRGKAFDRVLEEAEADCRAIANISDDYAVIFVQGGATLQFGLIPMNFLPDGRTADYADTGVWTAKAIKDAKAVGDVHVAFEGSATKYDHTPTDDEIKPSSNAAYFHYCSNNTIYGTDFHATPKHPAPLIADMSSNIFSGPIDIESHAMIYAGAQKNLGPSGVALIIARKDFLATRCRKLPSLMCYDKIADKGSRLNTPPTFGIYMMGQVFKWILREGGLKAMDTLNAAKSKVIYDAIDAAPSFYTAPAHKRCRSRMNIAFRCPTPELDAAFIAGAAEEGMDGLKGHRDTGGIRASIYNAFPPAGCEALAQCMRAFAAEHG
ncbi:MAG: 3-phosphoserine/phosphohydroxythreonine transaminase [Phycisphaerales bacterium]|nr:3-phosphoserine/phosphohydroxythreonine transaminase [Phycisphaerales bacterium]